MKKWSIPVMVVFWLMLGCSLSPLFQWSIPPRPGAPPVMLFRHPLVVGWAVLLALAQAVLLIRVKADGDRPRARRKLWPAVAAAAVCLGSLAAGLFFSLSMAAAGDGAFEGIGAVIDVMDRWFPGVRIGQWLPFVLFFGLIAGLWAVWWMFLWRKVRTSEPDAIVPRFTRWILAGSVIELLVAVPAHIICRRRDDCCAPFLTFWGMATGWALLLLIVGPAVMLLFEERMARKRRAAG